MKNLQSGGSARRRIAPRLLLAALLATWATAASAQALDTSRAARAPGAREVYASPETTIYAIDGGAVPKTAEAVSQALAADGWRRYELANTASAANGDMRMLWFKKGPQAMTALITLAPGGAAANVNYGIAPLANDLPFPPDATDIAFDANKPYLACKSAADVAATVDFFTRELGATGWKPAPGKVGDKSAKGAQAFFVRDGRRPLLLTVAAAEAGGVKIGLQSVSADLLSADAGVKKAPPPDARPAKAPAKAAAADDMADAIEKQARQMANSALADALAPAKPQPRAPAADAGPPLHALAGAAAPIPLPETAEDVDFEGAEGRLEFNSASSVAAVAAFFRGALKPLGWRERPSVINKPNMVDLSFAKDGKDLSLTVMQMGRTTNVTGNGAGLVTEAAKPEAEAAAAPAAAAPLEAEDSGGFPVPASHTMSGNESTPFRRGLNATVPAELAPMLAFYRAELTKRGWKELAPGTAVKADQATVAFAAPDGPAVLKLATSGGETTVTLVLRDKAKATKAGMLPKPGQGKILLGNMLGAEASISVNNKTLKVAAGAGSKAPDGPTLDLPPGKYKIVARSGGQAFKTSEVEIGADEVWGVLVGPGGVLPLQMY